MSIVPGGIPSQETSCDEGFVAEVLEGVITQLPDLEASRQKDIARKAAGIISFVLDMELRGVPDESAHLYDCDGYIFYVGSDENSLKLMN